jgi:DNA-binding YbaB/EbfC family protein
MNIQAMMKQAQKMQSDMMSAKNEIDKMTFIGNAQFITIEMNGKKEITKVTINKEEQIDDLEILEDMILLATNDAMKKVDKEVENKMGKYTSAMPGLF